MSIRDRITRAELQEVFGNKPRLIRAFEDQASDVDVNSSGLATTAAATEALNDATVLVLSPNTAFANERVLKLSSSLSGTDGGGELFLDVSDNIPKINGGFKLFLTVGGESRVVMPLAGTLATVQNKETLLNKTLNAPSIAGLGDYADDAAASAGGIPVTGIYRTGSTLKVRVT